jgi:hypothetical protein
MLGEAIALHISETALFHLLRRGYWRTRFWTCLVVRPEEDIRVSFSALVRLHQGDSYVLVRNLHRPETFAPFGGVYKHRGTSYLDRIDFRPQTFGSDDDMENDLRGFLPRKNLPRLVSWFKESKGRESADDCLTRELSEEIGETHLPRRIKCPELIHFQLIRSIQEGPEEIPGESYKQYRLFEVYDAEISKPGVKTLMGQLLKRATQGTPDLIAATSSEIRSGRTAHGHLIAPHASYLLGNRRIRKESPPMYSAATR